MSKLLNGILEFMESSHRTIRGPINNIVLHGTRKKELNFEPNSIKHSPENGSVYF